MMEENRKNRKGLRIVAWILGFIMALVLTFFISYFAVSKLYGAYLDKQSGDDEQEEAATEAVDPQENVDNCGFTMVYLDDPYTDKVEYCLLRVFNELSCKMSIFQIPTDAQVTLSDDTYEYLCEKAGYEIPITLNLSDIGTYFSERETKYEMINAVMQDYIGGIEVRSYEALDYDTFIQMIDLVNPVSFELTQIVSYLDENGETVQLSPNEDYLVDGKMALGMLTYSDGFGNGDGGRIDRTAKYLTKFVTSITASHTKEQMAEFLTSYYDMVLTTGSTDNEQEYVEDCLNLTEENLTFYTLKGTQTEEAYVLDRDKIQEDMAILMGEDEFTIATGKEAPKSEEDTSEASGTNTAGEETATKDTEGTTAGEATTESTEDTTSRTTTGISSKDLSISVYNGAYINGLAGKWKAKLQAEGYYISHVNNYEDAVLENARIIVRQDGMGEDLKRLYFPHATIEVGIPDDDDADIQIILGKSEGF